MANRVPLIVNTSSNQIQELPSGDNLDLTGSGIHNAGVITATSFSGSVVGSGNVVSGIITATRIDINGDLDVDGHTNLDNVSIAGVSTFTGAIDANGDLDVDGHTNLDNVSIAGVTTMSGDITISNTSPKISLVDTNHNDDFDLMNADGIFQIVDATNSANRLRIDSTGTVNVPGNLDVGAGVDVTGNVVASGNVSGVDGTFTGNVSIGGTLTYEDVTNIDSVGLITARTGVVSPYADIDDWIDVGNNIQLGNAGVITATTFKGGTFFGTDADINGDLDVDGHTNLDNVSIAGVTTVSSNVYIQKSGDAAFSLGSTNAGGATIVLDGDSNGDWIGNDYSSIRHDTAGNLVLTANSPGTAACYIKLGSAGHYGAMFTEGGSSLLRYNNNTKLETTTNGVNFGTGASDILLIQGQTLFRNGSNGSGIHFTTGAIYPTNNSGANNNGATNLGGTSNKFGTLFSTLVKSDRVDCDGLLHVQYGNATNTNYMSSMSNSNGIMHLFRGDGLYIGNNMNTSNQASGPNNKAITLGTNGAVTASGTVTAGSLVINGSAVQTHNSNDTNHTDNSLPAASSGFYVRNGNGTTGTFTSIGLIASSTGASSDQSCSLLAKCTASGLSPEVYLTQRDGNNSQRNTVAINTLGDITLIGNVTPSSDNTQNLGSGSKRWANIYTGDLNLSNEGSTNSVDGTWGSYTIEEGENDLFLHNKRTGKKYKFNLTEV